eukprot:CCRYP_001210-RA/>CCRYP_001210-RA protein AED:0.65 eAED:0.36 QI:0/-1/0/1/-1/1/1/0/317
MARANLIHASLRWPERSLLDLWPFAMSYAIWVHNRLPPHGYGLSPLELWSKVKSSHSDISRAHVFGCPVYVLDPALQDGKKIPKWNSRARQGIFVGFSSEHSSLVPLVFNPRSQRVSPQYHVIFDDGFSTVPSLHSIEERDRRFEELFQTSRESFLDPSGADKHGPPLDDDWLSQDEILQKSPTSASGQEPLTFDPMSLLPRPSARVPTIPGHGAPEGGAPEGGPPTGSNSLLPVPEGAESPDASASDVSDTSLPVPLPPSTQPFAESRYPRRVRSGDWKDGPALDRSHPFTKGRWVTGLLTCLLSVPDYALSVAHN